MCTHTSICELWTALLNLFGSTSLDHHGRLLSLSRTCHVSEREGSERERVTCTLARGAQAGGHDEEATT
jgi:hypothetical protein